MIRDAVRQLPPGVLSPTARAGGRVGRKVLVRIDGAGATHEVVECLTARRTSYPVGSTSPDDTGDLVRLIPASAWTAAYDADGHRLTASATNAPTGGPGTQLPDLEPRHRRRARCEDRTRVAKDTGPANPPLHDAAQNQTWLAVVPLACEITASMQMLALTGHDARRREPKRLRPRLFSIAAHLATTARTRTLRLSAHAAWTQPALTALDRITSLTAVPAPSG